MSDNTAKLLDEIGWRILGEMQQNARIPYAELGRRVGLSTPAVMDRVRRMEEAGIIAGYRVELNPAKIGFPILAFFRISVVGELLPQVIEIARESPEVLECHRVTGGDSFIMKVCVSSIEHLESFIDQLRPYVTATSSIVLSSAVTRRILGR
ncbi:MAG: Lrp/AsnC family transcriptional regulator [Bryobacteraceae bacterium]